MPDYMQAIDFTVLKQKVFSIVCMYLIDTVTVNSEITGKLYMYP